MEKSQKGASKPENRFGGINSQTRAKSRSIGLKMALLGILGLCSCSQSTTKTVNYLTPTNSEEVASHRASNGLQTVHIVVGDEEICGLAYKASSWTDGKSYETDFLIGFENGNPVSGHYEFDNPQIAVSEGACAICGAYSK